MTESDIIDQFITWADDNTNEDLAETLECADSADISFTSPDRGFILVDDEVFCSWCISANGNVSFKV
jgi:hypothetical protein